MRDLAHPFNIEGFGLEKQEKLRSLVFFADSIGMKSEFQKIFESKLDRHQSEETRAKESLSVESTWYSAIEFEKKFFFKNQKLPYSKQPKRQKPVFQEADYLKMKQEWVAEISNDEIKAAIEFFFTYGARAFLSRKISDIKRDFRKLALEYHPDRAPFQQKYSSAQCEEIFKKLLFNYQRLSIPQGK